MQIDQDKLMKHVVPGAMHVLLCTRCSDGAVGIFYSRDPVRFLIAINGHVPLEESEIRASEEAVQISVQLREIYKATSIADPSAPWYLTDFAAACSALEQLVRDAKRAGLRPGTQVNVRGEGRGQVVSFFKCGRIVVKLATSKLVSRVVLAPLDDVEPLQPHSLAQGEA